MTETDLRERILVVEDDEDMGALLQRGLGTEGYAVDVATNGVDALILATSTTYAATVLDIMLPGMSGFEICRRLRESQPAVPILLLTARDAVDDRVRGLDAGADDYLVKPFEFLELAARIRAIRRREGLLPTTVVTVADLVIDSHHHTVTAAGKSVAVSPKEFALLRLLAEKVGEPVSRATILTTIWGSTDHLDANVVDQYVSYLRRKLDPSVSGVTLATVRGVGYRLLTAPQ